VAGQLDKRSVRLLCPNTPRGQTGLYTRSCYTNGCICHVTWKGIYCHMSFLPCSSHGAPIQGKLATVISWWFNAEGKREAWRQRLCAPCLITLVGSLKNGASATSLELIVCPCCGSPSQETLDGVFLNIYPPKQAEREYALTTCGSCASELRKLLQVGAERMPDRQGVGAAAPTTPPESAWAEIPW
jgi:hypothetical protein